MQYQLSNQTGSRGVSPVVGVILMVAITVILAAVIGTFVLDLGQGQQQNAVAGVDISQTPDQSGTGDANVSVTVISMDQSDNVTVDFAGVSTTATSVGETVSHPGMFEGDNVVVIAERNGKQNVIQTYTVQ